MRQRRRRKLEPLPPPVYVTLAEVKARGLTVPISMLAPADRKRLAINAMEAYDILPTPELRDAVNNVNFNSQFKVKLKGEGGQEKVIMCDYARWAVILLDNGHSSAQIVSMIEARDRTVTERRRQDGTLPPATGTASTSNSVTG